MWSAAQQSAVRAAGGVSAKWSAKGSVKSAVSQKSAAEAAKAREESITRLHMGIHDPVLRAKKTAKAIAGTAPKPRPPMPKVPTTPAELANLTPVESKLLSDAAAAHTLFVDAAPILATASVQASKVLEISTALLAKDLKYALQARHLSTSLLAAAIVLQKLKDSWNATFAVTPLDREWTTWISGASSATAALKGLLSQASDILVLAQSEGVVPIPEAPPAAPVTAMDGLMGALAH